MFELFERGTRLLNENFSFVPYNILILIPFFYISIFVCNKSFFKSQKATLLWCIAFCSSILWYFVLFVFVYSIFGIFNVEDTNHKYDFTLFFLSLILICYFTYRYYIKRKNLGYFIFWTRNLMSIGIMALAMFVVLVMKDFFIK